MAMHRLFACALVIVVTAGNMPLEAMDFDAASLLQKGVHDRRKADATVETSAGTTAVGSDSADACGLYQYHADWPSEENDAPLVAGTEDNMEINGLDFTGIWWIRWGSFTPRFLTPIVRFYDDLHIEELYTFRGATSNTTGEFPQQMTFPSGTARQWGFTNSLVSRLGQLRVSLGKPDLATPNGTLSIDFVNSSYGFFSTPDPPDDEDPDPPENVWPFIKLTPDVWERPSILPTGNIMSYNATRIMTADGKRTQYWDAYLEQMKGYELRVFGSNDPCMRRCQAFLSVLTWSSVNGCGFCQWACS